MTKSYDIWIENGDGEKIALTPVVYGFTMDRDGDWSPLIVLEPAYLRGAVYAPVPAMDPFSVSTTDTFIGSD